MQDQRPDQVLAQQIDKMVTAATVIGRVEQIAAHNQAEIAEITVMLRQAQDCLSRLRSSQAVLESRFEDAQAHQIRSADQAAKTSKRNRDIILGVVTTVVAGATLLQFILSF